MTTPYRRLAPHAWWSASVSKRSSSEVDPVVSAPFAISRSDRIATAGSCFAQHIARALAASGYNYFVVENLEGIAPPEIALQFGYGVFSARYGNIYTARQLIQLFDRAHGVFAPDETAWESNGRWYDPFRPYVEPGGFATLDNLLDDREGHFASVRRMFRELDLFVFTLGLTECWECRKDGAVLPSCPGASNIGRFDFERYNFRNLTAGEVTEDLKAFVDRLQRVNPSAKVLLTVSPVPLIATMEERSVIVSNAYSKAALRVAADEVVRAHSNVYYFPSYEIITSNYSRAAYYESDFREVKAEGVDCVMSLFLRHYCDGAPPVQSELKNFKGSTARLISGVICDEERLVT